MKVLILLAHPAYERSRVNRRLAAEAAAIPGVTVHDLYEVYPSLNINVGREQELLRAHDVVVFQHPFYWYSTPSILKEWQDLVLEYGWAYGPGGEALAGKITFNALSAAGPEKAYDTGGYNSFTVRQLLAPYEATANLCKMIYLAPFVVHGVLKFKGDDYAAPVRDYRRVLEALMDQRVDLKRAAGAANLNGVLDEAIGVRAGGKEG